MRVMLTGANGQLGYRLAERLKDCIKLTRKDCDYESAGTKEFAALIDKHQPGLVINCASYTAVDRAEAERDVAMQVNGEAVRALAQVAEKQNIPLLHFSTDYVFDGARGAPYIEKALPNPLNAYGISKLIGEKAVVEAGGYVFRLQWVFDSRYTNFLRTMVKLMAEKDALRVVADARGAPSNAKHVADCIVAALPLIQKKKLAPGIYHLTAGGHTSWHGFATAIQAALKNHDMPCRTDHIEPVLTEEYTVAATRPKDTRLNCAALAEHGIVMPHWRDGLKDAMKELHAAA